MTNEMQAATRWERDRLGWVIVALNLLMAGLSTSFFLGQLRAGWDGWLAMNSCAPSIFLFAIGYACRSTGLLAVATGLMFRFGTLGLFFFGWDGANLVAQVGHIFMTVAVLYVAVRLVRRRDGQMLIVAALVAGAMLYAAWQGDWFVQHPQALEALFQGNLVPGK